MPVGGVIIGANLNEPEKFVGKLNNSTLAWKTLADNGTFMNAVAASETVMDAVVANETAMDAVAASETARDAIWNSELAWNKVKVSNIAVGKYVAGAAGLNPEDYADMNAVAASEIAMNAAAASEAARNAIWNSETARRALYLVGATPQTVLAWLKLVYYWTQYTPTASNIPWHYAERFFTAGVKKGNVYYFPSGDGNYYYTTVDFNSYQGSGNTDNGTCYDIGFDSENMYMPYSSNPKYIFNRQGVLIQINPSYSSWQIDNPKGWAVLPSNNVQAIWIVRWGGNQVEYVQKHSDNSTTNYMKTTMDIDLSSFEVFALVAIADENGNEYSFGIRRGRYYWE